MPDEVTRKISAPGQETDEAIEKMPALFEKLSGTGTRYGWDSGKNLFRSP